MIKIYFSQHFNVSPEVLDNYGAFDISIINDLPLFIDPFQLFNSKKPLYKHLHDKIIRYLQFLRDKSVGGQVNRGLLKAWYTFPEVKQNWLGFSLSGNKGRGLYLDFANSLNRNLNIIFKDFGKEQIASGSHLEKLCLIKKGVGKDSISDFTTNLIKDFLLEYTQTFAQKHIVDDLRRTVVIDKVKFNYNTETWEPKEFDLPYINDDYVVLTPKDILTKDDVWINKADLFRDYNQIANAIENEQLRAQINNYFLTVLPREASKEQRLKAISKVLERYPQILEYYIRSKEKRSTEAKWLSNKKVYESEIFYIKQILEFTKNLNAHTNFYFIKGDTLEEARDRVDFLKDIIENKGGHRIFYVDDQPIRRESDLQIMFRLTWFGTPSDISREVNNGRGPVDFKVSRGSKDKSLVEFKLASNTQLRRNLKKQVPIYEKASDTNKSLKVILYFTAEELDKVQKILKEEKLDEDNNIILIDARSDNKPSGSKA